MRPTYSAHHQVLSAPRSRRPAPLLGEDAERVDQRIAAGRRLRRGFGRRLRRRLRRRSGRKFGRRLRRRLRRRFGRKFWRRLRRRLRRRSGRKFWRRLRCRLRRRFGRKFWRRLRRSVQHRLGGIIRRLYPQAGAGRSTDAGVQRRRRGHRCGGRFTGSRRARLPSGGRLPSGAWGWRRTRGRSRRDILAHIWSPNELDHGADNRMACERLA